MKSLRLSDIAKLAGVSKATASRALAKSPRVKLETQKLVQEIANKHNYRPNSIAQAIATKRTNVIALLIYNRKLPCFGDTFFGPILDAAIDEASKYGYHIILSRAFEADTTFDEHFISDSIDGAILISNSPKAAVLEFKKRKTPLVLINGVLPTENNAFIIDENYNGMMKIMEHLIVEKKHKSIGVMIENLAHPTNILRYLAYIDAHKKYGLDVYENPIFRNEELEELTKESINYANENDILGFEVLGTPIICQRSNSETGIKAVKALINSENPKPTALVGLRDKLSIIALKALSESGVSVPSQMAVTGYDDVDFAEISSPALTTIGVNREELGRSAVRELLNQIKNPELKSRIISIENKLIVRKST